MTTEQNLPVEDRILQLLQHLGIQEAHFGARVPADWQGLATNYPEVISSLTLVCPPSGTDLDVLSMAARQLLVLNGDRGTGAEALRRVTASLPNATLVTLHDYLSPPWADVVADRTDDIGSAMMDFLGRVGHAHRGNPKTGQRL